MAAGRQREKRQAFPGIATVVAGEGSLKLSDAGFLTKTGTVGVESGS
jgi:hypothetical protein